MRNLVEGHAANQAAVDALAPQAIDTAALQDPDDFFAATAAARPPASGIGGSVGGAGGAGGASIGAGLQARGLAPALEVPLLDLLSCARAALNNPPQFIHRLNALPLYVFSGIQVDPVTGKASVRLRPLAPGPTGPTEN